MFLLQLTGRPPPVVQLLLKRQDQTLDQSAGNNRYRAKESDAAAGTLQPEVKDPYNEVKWLDHLSTLTRELMY